MKRPNIVFYFTDQQRWDTLGCYGQALPVTPRLDALAARGTVFDQAFTMQPVCGPARACLQTGLYATETGCFKNGLSLPRDRKTLADYFHEAGYDTAYVGKWHLASGGRDGLRCETSAIPLEARGGYRDYWMAADVLEFTSHGYNGYLFDGDNKKVSFIGYRPDCVNAYAVDYIHRRRRGNPFFLMVSQIEPHHQNDRNRFEGPDGSKERWKDYAVPGDLEGTGGDWRENYPDYLGQCNALDSNAGRLVDALKESGEWENTVFIYSSDHGCHFRTRNREYKRSCHDSSIRIPMIAHGPGFNGVGRVSSPVSLMDVPRTLLDCAGIQPDGWRGVSLLSLLREETPPREDVFLQISESQVGRAVRTPEYTYSVRGVTDGHSLPAEDVYYEDHLYDNLADPHQRQNLAAEPAYAGVREKLKARLLAYLREAEGAEPLIRPYSEKICRTWSF